MNNKFIKFILKHTCKFILEHTWQALWSLSVVIGICICILYRPYAGEEFDIINQFHLWDKVVIILSSILTILYMFDVFGVKNVLTKWKGDSINKIIEETIDKETKNVFTETLHSYESFLKTGNVFTEIFYGYQYFIIVIPCFTAIFFLFKAYSAINIEVSSKDISFLTSIYVWFLFYLFFATLCYLCIDGLCYMFINLNDKKHDKYNGKDFDPEEKKEQLKFSALYVNCVGMIGFSVLWAFIYLNGEFLNKHIISFVAGGAAMHIVFGNMLIGFTLKD